ncbi:MAG: outer membrane beta-barrel protein [Limisphaerales bacterium]
MQLRRFMPLHASSHRLAAHRWPAILAAVLAVGTGAALGADREPLTYYLELRGQDTNPLTDVRDAYGATFGVNWNEWLSFELALDNYELDYEPFGPDTLGEYSTWAIIPQVRVRYPFWHDRLVAYAIAGAGYGISQFNDRKPPGDGLDIDANDEGFLASVGGGLDYRFSDHFSIGAQFKYLFGPERDDTVDGVGYDTSVNAPLLMLAIKTTFPPATALTLADGDPVPMHRFYFGATWGGMLTPGEIGEGITLTPESPAMGDFNQLAGFSFGWNWSPNFGLELMADTFESSLNVDDFGAIGEIAMYDLVPHLKLRMPLDGGRWVPFVSAGVGAGYLEWNDTKPNGRSVNVEEDGQWGLAYSAALGVEYFPVRYFSLGAEARYLSIDGAGLAINGGESRDVDIDTLLIGVRLRMYLAEWGRRR